MKRRDLIFRSAPAGALAAVMGGNLANILGGIARTPGRSSAAENPSRRPPADKIPVAFVISDGAVMIDVAGPWEVFQDVTIFSRGTTRADQTPFALYTVSDATNPIRASDGMLIVPNYSFADAPAPKVVVIPAQKQPSAAMLDWIRHAAPSADVTMSVCTGAFLLAQTGLLDDKAATTHHAAYVQFAMQYPKIQLKRGARFVDEGTVASSGGLSSGIDLALHVVERYFGRDVAQTTAYQMEYQGRGWLDPNSNAEYAKSFQSTPDHPKCLICGMDVDAHTAQRSAYHGVTYYFCIDAHKAIFDAAPAKWS
jgi:putative intracellular protease/amidase/YHS domain-containing protein